METEYCSFITSGAQRLFLYNIFKTKIASDRFAHFNCFVTFNFLDLKIVR